MSETETIVRIAAKGDGVTASGRHVPRAVTGDSVLPDGSVEPGPHHVDPPCLHFAQCGGCQLQHADDAALRQFVTERVLLAADGQGVVPATVLDTHLSPPRSRRRTTLHFQRTGKRIVLGFREGRGRRIVDLAECHVLAPELFALVGPLRGLLAGWPQARAGDVALTMTDQGVDCELRGAAPEGLEQTEALTEFARAHGLARLSVDHGFGPETVWEPEPVTVTLRGVPVGYPPGAFLQATPDAQVAMVEDAARWLSEAATVADLFAGLGTFAFALGDKRVVAIEAARDSHLACKAAAGAHGRAVAPLHRDLFRKPLDAEELARFDAVILDPPRAGAREQVAQIAASDVTRVVYASCNPASWARDAKQLAESGFALAAVRPIGQFRWSTHVELTSLFTREGR